jgi:ABC-type sulfate transport system substrate-binding protein
MIAGGNWWRANEIVIRHLSHLTKCATVGVTKPRQVISGAQPADVVTLGLPRTSTVSQSGAWSPKDWRARLPNNAQPYTTTFVFVVRKGDPRGIHDWPDLVKGNVEIITPDPKTSGNGKLTLLAAWGSVVARGGSEAEAKDFVKAISRSRALSCSCGARRRRRLLRREARRRPGRLGKRSVA